MGRRIIQTRQGLSVPDNPIIPFIEGDGIGKDIWSASVRVFDSAVEKSYGPARRIEWSEVPAGEKAYQHTGSRLPRETIAAFKTYLVGIKGPLSTPVGGGHRSLNVALRQELDLYVCLRPIHYYQGVPSPVKKPELVDMVVFRENTEDVYAGLELKADSRDARKLRAYLKAEFGWDLGEETGIGIKPISRPASERLIRAAISYAIADRRKSVTLVHKGNIQKYTEGAFLEWGYELAKREFGDRVVFQHGTRSDNLRGPAPAEKVLIKDSIADIFLQQILTRPEEFDVIATTNLNGDYFSDALAAQVGGVGIAPGANINYETGCALFEATHGSAPKYAGKNMVNPSSLILSGALMFDYLGWQEAARLIESGIARSIADKTVTYDFARRMKNAHEVSTEELGDRIIANMTGPEGKKGP